MHIRYFFIKLLLLFGSISGISPYFSRVERNVSKNYHLLDVSRKDVKRKTGLLL